VALKRKPKLSDEGETSAKKVLTKPQAKEKLHEDSGKLKPKKNPEKAIFTESSSSGEEDGVFPKS